MSFLSSLYQKSVADNERNLRFWEDYLNNLKLLDFSVYADKLKVPTLVPIGSRIFFRGDIKHTNEVTVALGADYFVKCSLVQADILRQHRVKDAESKLESFKKEKEYLANQLSFTQQNIFEKSGQEIVEVFTEEEDKAWRQKHRENVRKFKQGEAKQVKSQHETTDDELWTRLEELELEEELENELLDNYNEVGDKRKENSFLVNEEQTLVNTYKQERSKSVEAPETDKCTVINENTMCLKDNKESNETKSKLDLLQQVLDKQNLLEDRLLEIKNRERQPSKTEKDLMAKLDEIEQLEELEEQMDRLEDILETEDLDSDDDETIDQTQLSSKLKKSISFADEHSATVETTHITFKHSDVEPSNTPYNREKGISKPSDIYESHSHLFNNGKKSILKKSKYVSDFIEHDISKEQVPLTSTEDSSNFNEHPVKETIVIKDVVENSTNNRFNIDTGVRPASLFKKKRMQNKS